jgi:hypothetical protein
VAGGCSFWKAVSYDGYFKEAYPPGEDRTYSERMRRFTTGVDYASPVVTRGDEARGPYRGYGDFIYYHYYEEPSRGRSIFYGGEYGYIYVNDGRPYFEGYIPYRRFNQPSPYRTEYRYRAPKPQPRGR